jgi:DNA-binding CsgD family transcriptional regulator
MNESLQVILLTGSLITGILALLLSNQLIRRYSLPYLSSYFYYLIFLFVFGIYGIIGTSMIRIFLTRHGMDFETTESISLFVTYLGIPFLGLSWFMFIRLSHEIVNAEIHSVFNLAYFGILSLGFIGFGLLLVKQDLLGENRYAIINAAMRIGFTGLTLMVYVYSLVQLFLRTGKFLDAKDRYNIRLFGMFYVLFAVGTILLVYLSERKLLYGLAFILFIFAMHLLPLFFLSMYLDKNFIDPAEKQAFDESLGAFIGKFEISRRESEIVELICRGKSNQDISDSLFISLQTVKDHIHRIYLKTGVKNRVQLTNLIRTFS